MLPSFVIRRRHAFFVRARVPVEIVSIIRKTHVSRALGTSRVDEARVRAGERLAAIQRGFREIRVMAERLRITSLDDLNALLDAEVWGVDVSPEAVALMPRQVRAALERRMKQINVGTEASAMATRIEVMSLESERARLSSAVTAVCDAEADAARLALEDARHRQLLEALARLEAVPPTAPMAVKLAAGAVQPFYEHAEDFYGENTSVGTSARDSYDLSFSRLKKIVGEKPISNIDKNDILEYRQLLLNANSAKHGKDRLAHSTIKKALSNLKTFFSWAVSKNLCVENPATEVHPPRESKKTSAAPKRLAYTNDELLKIFDAPLFIGCKSERFVHKPGSFLCRDGRFFLPVVALLTGARLGELEQLRVKNVYKDEGFWMMDINEVPSEEDDEEDKSVKTLNSVRIVPIHPVLQKIGFLNFVDERRKNGDNALVFNVNRLGRFWNQFFLKNIGIKHTKICFHSFRHNYKKMVRAYISNAETANRLMGHAPSTVGEIYGQGLHSEEIRQFCELTKPDVDLTHLYDFR